MKEIDELKNLENIFKQTYTQLVDAKNSSVFNSRAFGDVKKSIETVILKVEQERNSLYALRVALSNIAIQYEETEKNITKFTFLNMANDACEPTNTNNREGQIDEYAKQWDIIIGDCQWTNSTCFRFTRYRL